MQDMKQKKINNYWLDRAKQRTLEDIRDTEHVIKLVEAQYRKSLKQIENEIAMLFYRYAEDNELDYSLATKLLTSDEYKDFRFDLAEYMKLIDDPNILLELNTLSAKSRITRLEKSFFEVQKQVDEVYLFQYEQVENLMEKTVKDNYYKTLFDLGVGESIYKNNFHKLTKAEIIKEFSRPWSGKNFSQRLWKNRTKLKEALEEEIIQAAIQGTNTQAAAKRLIEKFDVSKKTAGRLIHTEQTYFSSIGSKKAYEEMKVDKYIYIATLDTRTSEICAELDHQVFDIKDGQPGLNMPPMHPRCRSTTAPYRGELKGTRTARDKDNNSVKVDKSLSYKEWYKKYVEKGE